MKTRWYVAGALGLAGFAALGTAGVLRNQTPFFSAPSDLLPTLMTLEPGAQGRRSDQMGWLWETPDVAFRRVDPWTASTADPFVRLMSGPVPASLWAWEPFGLIRPVSASAPTDWARWQSGLGPSSGPLALAGRSPAELVTAILWFAEGLGTLDQAEAVRWVEAAADPGSGLKESGELADNHPWLPALDEIRRWQASGRLAAGWWDSSEEDVLAALRDKRAAWGLVWGQTRAAAADKDAWSFGPSLPWPGKRTIGQVGRWIERSAAGGWASAETTARFQTAVDAATERLWSAKGLVRTDPDLPPVNQETKAFGLRLLSAGSLIAAPSSDDGLKRWQPVLDAARQYLRR